MKHIHYITQVMRKRCHFMTTKNLMNEREPARMVHMSTSLMVAIVQSGVECGLLQNRSKSSRRGSKSNTIFFLPIAKSSPLPFSSPKDRWRRGSRTRGHSTNARDLWFVIPSITPFIQPILMVVPSLSSWLLRVLLVSWRQAMCRVWVWQVWTQVQPL